MHETVKILRLINMCLQERLYTILAIIQMHIASVVKKLLVHEQNDEESKNMNSMQRVTLNLIHGFGDS